jgi:hypothetical protein
MFTLTDTKLIEIFYNIDGFMQEFDNQYPAHVLGKYTQPKSHLSVAEILTLTIAYHHSRMDCFKSYYKLLVEPYLREYFPEIPCYERFVVLKNAYLLELFAFFYAQRAKPITQDANYIDSKKLESCHIKREHSHRTMKNIASKGKSSTGWFYGTKIHLLINEKAELCRFMFTGGAISDNNEHVLKTLFKGLEGVVYGDKGYISKFKKWFEMQGLTLITKVRKNMKPLKLSQKQKHYLKRRALSETVFGLLTFSCDIDHTRHRSPKAMATNLVAALIAYTYFEHLPQLKRYTPKQIKEQNIVLFLAN